MTPAQEARLYEIRVRFGLVVIACLFLAIGLNTFGEEPPLLLPTSPAHVRQPCTLTWQEPSWTEWAAAGFPAPADRYIVRAAWSNGAVEETTVRARFNPQYAYVIPFGAQDVSIRSGNAFGVSGWIALPVPPGCP